MGKSTTCSKLYVFIIVLSLILLLWYFLLNNLHLCLHRVQTWWKNDVKISKHHPEDPKIDVYCLKGLYKNSQGLIWLIVILVLLHTFQIFCLCIIVLYLLFDTLYLSLLKCRLPLSGIYSNNNLLLDYIQALKSFVSHTLSYDPHLNV